MPIDPGLETSVRRALGLGYSTFTQMEMQSKWSSHHADFYHIILKKNNRRRRNLVAKSYRPVGEGHETAYALSHDPNVLFPRELRNLKLLNEIVKNSIDKPRTLVPKVMGTSDLDFTIVMEYISGKTQRDTILEAARAEDSGVLDDVFLKGVRLIARFSGLCNYYRQELVKNFDYVRDADFLEKSSQGQLKENLARLFYLNNPALVDHIGPYSYSKVFEHLLTGRTGINLDARVSELHSLRKGLNEKSTFQHNDCNGLNIVANTVLDLESFGLRPSAADISSYCTIVGLGNTTMLHRDQFNFYRHAYLASEYAWESLDASLVQEVEGYRNGKLKSFVGQIMSRNQYADWTMSFFAQAIEKNVQLGASYNRYSPQEQAVSSGTSLLNDPDKIDQYMQELFLIVHGLDPLIQDCTNPSGVREYFYTLGRTMQDLGYNVSDELLSGIKKGSVAGGVLGEVPSRFKPA